MFDRIRGKAGKMDIDKASEELEEFLLENEKVEIAFKLVRDMIVFTNYRLITVDKQGLRGKKQELHIIPYKSITHYSIETAGTFDRDADLKIWIASMGERPLEKEIKKGEDIRDLQKALTTYVCK